MSSRGPLQVSEARKRLSALVERVARGGTPVTIGRYGRERAVLVGADQYARLSSAAQKRTQPLRSIEGTMELACSPEELVAESRLGELRQVSSIHSTGSLRRPRSAWTRRS